MQITAYTGSVEIESKAGYEIYIKPHVKSHPNIGYINSILKSPNKLILPEGRYSIFLKKNDVIIHGKYPIKIEIGTAQKYIQFIDCISKNNNTFQDPLDIKYGDEYNTLINMCSEQLLKRT